MSSQYRPELHGTDAPAYQNPGVVPVGGETGTTIPAPPTNVSSTMGGGPNPGVATAGTGAVGQEPPPTTGIARHGTEHVGHTGQLEGASSMEIKKHNIYGHLEKAVGSLTGNQEMRAAGQAKITESLAAIKGSEAPATQAAYVSFGRKC